jgi:hypothetical protein
MRKLLKNCCYVMNLIATAAFFHLCHLHFYSFFVDYFLLQKWVPLSIRMIRPIFCMLAFHLDSERLSSVLFLFIALRPILSNLPAHQSEYGGLASLLSYLFSIIVSLPKLSIFDILLGTFMISLAIYPVTCQLIHLVFSPIVAQSILSYSVIEATTLLLLTVNFLFPDLVGSRIPEPRIHAVLSFLSISKFCQTPLSHLDCLAPCLNTLSTIPHSDISSVNAAYSCCPHTKTESALK